ASGSCPPAKPNIIRPRHGAAVRIPGWRQVLFRPGQPHNVVAEAAGDAQCKCAGIGSSPASAVIQGVVVDIRWITWTRTGAVHDNASVIRATIVGIGTSAN